MSTAQHQQRRGYIEQGLWLEVRTTCHGNGGIEVEPMALLLLNERMTDWTAKAVGIKNRGLGYACEAPCWKKLQ
jgi:hypothetical protein